MNIELPEADDFKQLQYAFAAHLRNPARHPAPGDIEDRRMQIYRDLFYNNVENFLRSGYPVIRTLYSDGDWHAMVRDFYANHRSTSPQFFHIAAEFLYYLGEEREPHDPDPPFLLELAHYEWVELDLSIADDSVVRTGGVDPNGDLMAGIPLMSPVARNLAYQFPVHEIGPDFQPDTPGEIPTCLVVYRDRSDDVRFMQVNAVTSRLLELIKQRRGRTGRELLQALVEELQHPKPDVVIEGGAQTLQDLRARDILLGCEMT